MSIRIGGLAVGVTMIVPAGGSGSRFGAAQPKQFLPLAGQPILLHALRVFERCSQVDDVVMAVPRGQEEMVWSLIRGAGLRKVTRIVAGGADRQSSVWAALSTVSSRPRVVGVHDGARPLLSLESLTAMLEAAATRPAQVMAVAVKDTIKVVGPAKEIVATPDRATLWAAQTPQVFHAEVLCQAHLQAQRAGLMGTDESQIVEALGVPVHIFPGTPENFKITTAQDLMLAEMIMAGRRQ